MHHWRKLTSCKARLSPGKLIASNVSKGKRYFQKHILKFEILQGHSLDGLVRLTSVIGINIKPNEDKAYADEPFMPMSPMDALKSGSYNQDVDVLIGTNLNDGLILTTPLYTTPSLYFLYRHLWYAHEIFGGEIKTEE